jgi:hypothetical protein
MRQELVPPLNPQHELVIDVVVLGIGNRTFRQAGYIATKQKADSLRTLRNWKRPAGASR